MNKFTIPVVVACESLDTEVVRESLAEALREMLPDGTLALVQKATVKPLTEQGFKVLRSRVFGIDAETAGDAANPKAKKVEAPALEAPAAT